MTVLRELSRYKLNLVCVQGGRREGRAVAPNQQEGSHFSTEREMRTMN
jgi:hypothetical protein